LHILLQEYKNKLRPNFSFSTIPQGKEYFAALIRQRTSTTLTPTDVYEIGLREIERINQEMDSIRKMEGFNGSLQDFTREVLANASYITESVSILIPSERNIKKSSLIILESFQTKDRGTGK
jgi:uncharacterized protein (DUF885 family)